MLDEKLFKQIITAALVLILFVFVYLIIKPIFFSILFGLILAYAFYPANKKVNKRIKNETISSLITCVIILTIIAAITWFLFPILAKEIFDFYLTVQNLDLITFIEKSFPFLFATPQISANFISAYNTFISTITSQTLSHITAIISDLPALALKFFIVLVVFFYGLRDGDKILNFIRETMPFSKNVTNRLITKSKQVTFSVIYGRIIVGLATGILTGIGFYMVGIESALLLTFFAIFASIIPIVGPWAIWIPVVIGLLVVDRVYAALFILFYGGIIINIFEHVVHPLIVSKTSKIPNSLTLIGLIGGILVFGIFGIILGPLIMAYVTVLFEIYRESNTK